MDWRAVLRRAPSQRRVGRSRRLHRRLLALVLLLATLGLAATADQVSSPPAAMERLELVATDDVASVQALVERLGGHIEVTSGDRVQALVPIEVVSALRGARGVVSVEEPGLFVPLQVANDVGALLGAERWNEAGFTGRGVKVAIVDAGFRGYRNRLGTSLPSKTTARSFRADVDPDSGTDHGTLAAEVVHSIAPNAELYLLSFGTVTELAAAADFIESEGIDIVSFSLGFIHNGPGDGTGPVDAIVSRSTANGALWVISAGNWARQHWSGPFLDTNGDSIHEFAPGATLNGRDFQAGDLIILSLRWDDEWGAACSDFDLELFGPSGTLARASRRPQDCSGDPVEGLQVLATESGRYSARIVDAGAEEGKTLDLLFVGSPDRAEVLDQAVAAGSLSEPADHPAAVTVGATSPSGALRAAVFSSRGPTSDGRSKPEVISPTGQGLPGQATFAGTSAAAPHVAALAAILAEARPDADPATLRNEIQTRSVLLTGAPQPGAPERLANLGPLSGLGPLLPVGAETAELLGPPPPDAGLAVVVYVGPNGYPVRFAQNLTEPRVPLAFFRFDTDAQTFDRYIIGAPEAVQTFEAMDFGTPYVVRFAAP